MKYHIFTLGCQMNENDSERIATVLENLSFTPAKESEADLIIANLCSVRQKAIDRVWGKLKNWEKIKSKPKIFLTGCILPGDRRKLSLRVDKIFDISDLPSFPTLILKNLNKDHFFTPSMPEGPTLIKNNKLIKSNDSLSYLDIIPKRSRTDSAFIPIATGCDNFCSYCAVPYTRGREISRPKKEILAEIKALIKKGYKHILLLGQNVNSYNPSGQKRKKLDNSAYISLLKTIDKLPGRFKFNFMSSNPHDMSSKLIKTYAKLKKWDKNLHIAMQSGDDKILKKMNRKYTSSQFLKLIKKIRAQIPNLKLSTDIIVGFPDESKKAFENTLKISKKADFDKAYISMYSPREKTLAFQKYKDNVPHAEKKRRWKILDDLINKRSKSS